MYCSVDDIKKRIPEEILIGLTQDNSSATTIDDTKIETAILDSDKLIDFHLYQKYEVPFNPVPVIINLISVGITKHNLYKRKYDVEFPEAVENEYNESLTFLREIQNGEITIAGATKQDDTSEQFVVVTNIEEDDIVYDDDMLDKI